MNKTFSSEQISKTGSHDANLKSRQYKLYLMAISMEINSVNPRLKQYEVVKGKGCSSSTLQRYRNDKKMLSPYRILPNNTDKRRQKISNTNSDDNSHRKRDGKRPQLTSNDLKSLQLTSNNLKRPQLTSNDLKSLQLTSNNLKRPQLTSPEMVQPKKKFERSCK